MFEQVSSVIPGASNERQLFSNLGVEDEPGLTDLQMEKIAAVYRERIKQMVHHLW